MSAPSPVPDLSSVRARRTSDGDLVTATVDGSGRLVGLEFDPKAMRMPSLDLADLVRRTVDEAQDAARAEASALLEQATPAVPAEGELMATLAGLQDTAFARLGEMSEVMTALLDRTGPRA